MQRIWNWLPSALVIIITFGTIYACGHYILRQGANDPQIEMSENIAQDLSYGRKVIDIIPQITINPETSKSPFVVIYDEQGRIVAGNLNVRESVPIIPFGVLKHAKERGQNRITWEPLKDLRIATVTTPYTGTKGSGYVLVGRSLREVERRDDAILTLAQIGLLTALITSFLLSVFILPAGSKKK